MDYRDKKLASIKLHPAVIILFSLAFGSTGYDTWSFALITGDIAVLQQLGKWIALFGGLILIFAYSAMAIARTTIDPRQHTSAIVSSGIYRLSRNPIYIGWFLILLGIGLKNQSLFVMMLSLIMIALLHWAVVLKEERYLEDAFGEEYLQYKSKVRRWL